MKGRHPLLKDVDVTINPSKSLALVKGRETHGSGKVTKLLNLTHLNGYSGDPVNDMLEENDSAATLSLRSRQQPQRKIEVKDAELQEVENGALGQVNSLDAELIKEEEVSPVDSERGQVLQTAQMVMNMLDMSMPDTLTEDKKKKVTLKIQDLVRFIFLIILDFV